MKKISLTQTQLKTIAICAMFLDHFAEAFFTNPIAYELARGFGRITGPTMFFFLSEGFVKTSSRKKYMGRLFFFAIVSQVPFSLFHGTTLYERWNVGVTLFLSALALLSFEYIKSKELKYATLFLIIFLTVFCDWGIIGPLVSIGSYLNRTNKKRQGMFIATIMLLYFVLTILLGEWSPMYLGLFLFPMLFFLYKGEKGGGRKWIFYVFYPVHLFLLYIFRIFL